MRRLKYLSISTLIPSISLAQVQSPPSSLYSLLVDFGGILTYLVPIIFGLTMVYFFWNTANFILKDAANEKTRQDGIKRIIWGVVAIFVFLSLYGILDAVANLIGFPRVSP